MKPTVTGIDNARIAVIALGSLGLPLAAEFGRAADTIGFDINAKRIEELQVGHDRTRELSAEELADIPRLRYAREERKPHLRASNVNPSNQLHNKTQGS